MDYGYQLLRHVVQQVMGNLPQAARITLVPILLGYAICYALIAGLAGPDAFAMLDPTAAREPQIVPEIPNNIGGIILAGLLSIPVLVVTYSWAAVGWHRYVLLEELPSGFAAPWNGSLVRSYIGAAIRLVLMLILVGIVVGVVSSVILVGAIAIPGVAFLWGIGVAIGFTWVATRLGLVLPSASLGEYMKLGDSWSVTKPVSSAIILPIIVIPVVFSIIGSIFGFIPILGFILTLVLYWLQLLFNLALMTTLYGSLVEGRKLN